MEPVSKKYLQDQAFREVVNLVYGDGAGELIRKASPDGADLSTSAKKDRRNRAITAGLSAVGATAGAAGLGYAGLKTGGAYRAARAGSKGVSRGKAIKSAIKNEKIGAALVPLEVAGLGGELMATHILHGDTKRNSPVRKDITEIPETAQLPKSRGELTRAVTMTGATKGMEYSAKGAKAAKTLPNKVQTTKGRLVRVKEKLSKQNVELTWSGEIAKADHDKQQLFGWASVIEVNGEPVIDLQGDRISTDEMEKSAYEYVVKSRKGGDMHLRDEWQPVHKSDMIESFMVTPEKRSAMGLPDSVPTGWWVGFQVNDPEVWSKVRSGERTGFSIHGRGKREAVG